MLAKNNPSAPGRRRPPRTTSSLWEVKAGEMEASKSPLNGATRPQKWHRSGFKQRGGINLQTTGGLDSYFSQAYFPGLKKPIFYKTKLL